MTGRAEVACWPGGAGRALTPGDAPSPVWLRGAVSSGLSLLSFSFPPRLSYWSWSWKQTLGSRARALVPAMSHPHADRSLGPCLPTPFSHGVPEVCGPQVTRSSRHSREGGHGVPLRAGAQRWCPQGEPEASGTGAGPLATPPDVSSDLAAPLLGASAPGRRSVRLHRALLTLGDTSTPETHWCPRTGGWAARHTAVFSPPPGVPLP